MLRDDTNVGKNYCNQLHYNRQMYTSRSLVTARLSLLSSALAGRFATLAGARRWSRRRRGRRVGGCCRGRLGGCGATPNALHQLLDFAHAVRIQQSTCGRLQATVVDLLESVLQTVNRIVVAVDPRDVQIRATRITFGLVGGDSSRWQRFGGAASAVVGGCGLFAAAFDGHLLVARDAGRLNEEKCKITSELAHT